MPKSSTMDNTKPCRVCQETKNTQEMQLITADIKIKSMIETICGINLDNNETKLKYLCKTCETTIENSYKLRQLAQNARQSPKKRTSDVKEEKEESKEMILEIKPEEIYDEVDDGDFDEPIEVIEIDEIPEILEIPATQPYAEAKCRLCLRMIKETYLNDHEQKCNGRVTKHICHFPHCNKRFVQRKSLKIHTASRHFNQKPFQCDFCQKFYASKNSLKGHLISHKSERTEACFVCGAKFKSKLSLFKHKVIHENNVYRCSVCTARFKCKYDCNYHERVKHFGQTVMRKNPNPSFPCDECEKVYKTNDSLKRHVIRVHKNLKDFVCWAANCTAKYGFHSSLKKHIAKNHPEINLTGLRIVPDPNAGLTHVKEEFLNEA